MRLTAVIFAAATTLAASASAAADWTAPVDAGRTGLPFVAGSVGDEGVVWTDGRRPNRLAWGPGAPVPSLSRLPALPRASSYLPWAVNRRGDLLVTSRAGGRVRAVGVDAGGGVARLVVDPPNGVSPNDMRAEVGPDGTMAVAWTGFDDRDWSPGRWWLATRRAGGAFGTPIVVRPEGGSVHDLGLAVGEDGRVHVAVAVFAGPSRTRLLYGVMSPTGPALTFMPVTSAGLADPRNVDVLSEALGGVRVVFQHDDGDAAPWRVAVVRRLADGTWAPKQLFAGSVGRASMAALSDGSVLLAHQGRPRPTSDYAYGHLLVRRAAPGEPFGEAQLVSRAPRGNWLLSDPVLATSVRGNAIVAWAQTTEYEDLDRLIAATAPPGGAFGPATLVAPLGTDPDESLVLAAISDTGGPLIVWRAGRSGVQPAGHLLAVRRDADPEVPLADDGRPPRVRAVVKRSDLRAAARTARLRVRAGCDEACDLHVGLLSSRVAYARELTDLPRLALTGGRARTVRVPLSNVQRRTLRMILRRGGRLFLDVVVSDAAGNFQDTTGRLARRQTKQLHRGP